MTKIAIEFNGFHFGLVCFTLLQISVLTPHAGSFLSTMESQKALESSHCIFFQGGATVQIAGCFLLYCRVAAWSFGKIILLP